LYKAPVDVVQFCALYGYLLQCDSVERVHDIVVARVHADDVAFVSALLHTLGIASCALGRRDASGARTLRIAERRLLALLPTGTVDDDEQRLPWWLWLLDRDAKRAVVRGMRRASSGGVERHHELCVQSVQSRDELVRLCLAAGWSAHFTRAASGNKAWCVRYASHDDGEQFAPVLRGDAIRKRAYTGRVWCFVTRNGFIWTRRVHKDAAGCVVKASRALLTGSEHG
jgi:hypothetical protein